jgi:hypothetical protein
VKRGGTKKKSKIAPLKKSCKQRRKNIKKHCDERNSKKKHQAYQFIIVLGKRDKTNGCNKTNSKHNNQKLTPHTYFLI